MGRRRLRGFAVRPAPPASRDSIRERRTRRGGERGGDAPSVAPYQYLPRSRSRARGPRSATRDVRGRGSSSSRGERLSVPSPISARGSPRVPSNRGAGMLAGIAAAAAGGGAAGAVARAAELALMRERVVVREEKERRTFFCRNVRSHRNDDRDEDDERDSERDSSMIVPRDRPRDRPASARVSAIQNAATAARQRERVLVATRAAEAARAKLAAAEANVRVAELGVDARRDDDDGASRQPGSDGRRSGVFPASAKMAPASARKPTENRKPIAANRGSPAPSRLASARDWRRPPASLGGSPNPSPPWRSFPRRRGARLRSRAAPPGTTWRRPSPSRRRRGGARGGYPRGDQRTETVGVRARERAKSRAGFDRGCGGGCLDGG